MSGAREFERNLLKEIRDAVGGGTGVGDLVFSVVQITQSSAGVVDLGVGATGEVVRLHGEHLTADALLTYKYISDTAGDGVTGATDRSPAMKLGSGAGPIWGPDYSAGGKISSVVSQHLTFKSSTNPMNGWVVISKGPA